MPAPIAPAPLPGGASPEALLRTLLAMSPMGILLLRPLYAGADAAGITDFAWEQLNPAAQRMLQLPECPPESLLALVPAAGVFSFCRDAFLSGQVERYPGLYQVRANGPGGGYQLVAQRQGPLLVVSLTDASPQLTPAVEEALRASQAREQAARAEAGARQRELQVVFEQAPLALALLRGPAHVVEFANARMAQIWGRPLAEVQGRPHFQALPDLTGQGFEAVFDDVWRTGKAHYLQEQAVTLHPAGRPYHGYFNITYQPAHDGQGQRTGIIASAIEVTEQVRARQQVEQLNEELAATNEELRTSNEEYLLANAALSETQLQLHQLNQVLEGRVQERTRQLEARQSELQRLFAQAPMAIVVLRGPQFIVEQANERAEAIWGRTAAQVLGRPHFEALPDAAGQGYEELLTGVLTSGTPLVLHEVPIELARDHTGLPNVGYYNIIFKPLRDAQQHVSGIVVMWTETTEQVRARRQLEQLNEELEARVLARTRELAAAQAATERERAQLQALLTQAPVAISLLQGDELRVAMANTQMATIWGYTSEQVVGRPLLEGVPELQGQGFDDLLRQVLRTRVPFVGTETPVQLLREGTLHTGYYNFVYQPHYDGAGQVVGVLIVAVEVTAQVRARRQAQQLNQELEARVAERTQQLQLAYQTTESRRADLTRVFEHAAVAFTVFKGPAHIIDQANPEMAAIWGVPLAQLLGRPVAAALPAMLAQGFAPILDSVFGQGQAQDLHELPVQIDRQGQRPPLGYYNITLRPERDAHGHITGIIGLTQEVTEAVVVRQLLEHQHRREQLLNEELAVANEELQATNEDLHEVNTQLTRTNVDLDTFVYTASHDLKAPIANLEGLLTALRHELPAAVQQQGVIGQLLGLMEGATERFRLTINQLTDVSRLQHAQNQPAEHVLLAGVVAGVQLDLEPLLASTRAELLLDIDPDIAVLFAPKNLRSVVYNLLSNAIKYHQPGQRPLVRLHALATSAQVVLTVTDNGLGLTEQQQTRLFGLFQRLHTHVEGTGVGLYMVKRMVENAGGTIAVRSQVGVGSVFQVTFPAGRAK